MVVVTGEVKKRKARMPLGICLSTVTLVALLNVPATAPSWPEPVASDLKVTDLPPKSATPPEAIVSVYPELIVRLPVLLRVRDPPTSKCWFKFG